MKIAAGATMLGLGGLGGYALANNQAVTESTPASSAAAQGKPKVHTQVVHRTIHVRPHGGTSGAPARQEQAAASSPPSPSSAAPAVAPAPAPAPAPASAPAAPTEPVSTHTSGAPSSSSSSSSSTQPVSTHTSGSSGSSGSTSYGDDDGGAEHESEGGDD